MGGTAMTWLMRPRDIILITVLALAVYAWKPVAPVPIPEPPRVIILPIVERAAVAELAPAPEVRLATASLGA